jgi:hypothetical protein
MIAYGILTIQDFKSAVARVESGKWKVETIFRIFPVVSNIGPSCEGEYLGRGDHLMVRDHKSMKQALLLVLYSLHESSLVNFGHFQQ